MNVFISYSRKGVSSVQSLNAALNAADIDTFLVSSNLVNPGFYATIPGSKRSWGQIYV